MILLFDRNLNDEELININKKTEEIINRTKSNPESVLTHEALKQFEKEKSVGNKSVLSYSSKKSRLT